MQLRTVRDQDYTTPPNFKLPLYKELYIWAGPVLSSKSTRALGTAVRLERLGHRVVLVRPRCSVRSHEKHGVLRTRAGDEWLAHEVDTATQIPNKLSLLDPTVVWLDEPALFEEEEHLYNVVQDIRTRHIVMISGCSATSELEPFGTSFPKLIAVADEVEWCKADCDFSLTLNGASRSVCFKPKQGQKLVGGAEIYRPASVGAWLSWRTGQLTGPSTLVRQP